MAAIARKRGWWGVGVCAALAVAWAAPVAAQEAGAEETPAVVAEDDAASGVEGEQGVERDWRLGVEVLTEVPVHIGARVAFETDFGLRASLAVGFLPGAYVDLINEICTGAGWYNDATAALISVALSESLILRLHTGWRPFADEGFYFDVGYTLAALGGDASTAEVLEEASGTELPTREGSRLDSEFDIDSTLHLIDVELGWEWLLAEHWTIRTALAYAGTLGASTTVTALFDPENPALTDAFETGVATYLDDIYTSYVHTAVITVAFGYRIHP